MPHRPRLPLISLVVHLLGPVLLALNCLGHTVTGSPPGTVPVDLTATPPDNYFPNIILYTQDNQPQRFYDDLLRGKVVLINFMYVTCGDICPLATANLVQVQNALGERLGREVFIYSITLEPQTDTPEILRQYAAGYQTRPGWFFLTGREEDIHLLRRKLGVYDRDPLIDADKTQHSGLIVYGNEVTGKWAMIPALLNPVRIVQAVLRVMRAAPGTPAPGRP